VAPSSSLQGPPAPTIYYNATFCPTYYNATLALNVTSCPFLLQCDIGIASAVQCDIWVQCDISYCDKVPSHQGFVLRYTTLQVGS
jgi:hypothetical protein